MSTKEYYQKHKEAGRKYSKKYYWKNREKIKEYWEKNKEKKAKYLKEWREKNKGKRREYFKDWRQKNSEHRRKYTKEYFKKRRRIDPRFRLDESISTAIYHALKGRKTGKRWEDLTGYTIGELIMHLEKQFDDKMSWENYGSYWAVDHIKPIALFNYASSEDPEFKECWVLKNLQPMEKIANIIKGKNYEPLTIPEI